MGRFKQFLSTYRLYAAHHPRIYAARLAYAITYRGLPF